jgi:FtsH-binding integral membrane protein
MQDNRFMNTAAATSSQIDVGLRAYMLGVYNHMTTALLLTGFFAYATKMLATTTGPDGQMYLTPLGSLLFNTPLGCDAGAAWHGVLAVSPHSGHVSQQSP